MFVGKKRSKKYTWDKIRQVALFSIRCSCVRQGGTFPLRCSCSYYGKVPPMPSCQECGIMRAPCPFIWKLKTTRAREFPKSVSLRDKMSCFSGAPRKRTLEPPLELPVDPGPECPRRARYNICGLHRVPDFPIYAHYAQGYPQISVLSTGVFHRFCKISGVLRHFPPLSTFFIHNLWISHVYILRIMHNTTYRVYPIKKEQKHHIRCFCSSCQA